MARVSVHYTAFGEMAISVGGVRQPLTRRRERGVLSVLLAAHGAPVAAERLLAEVWGDDAPGQTLGSLQVAVSRLRTQLEPDRAARKGSRLVSTAAGYSLTAEVDDVDTWRFEALAEQALAADAPDERLAASEEAIALWTSTPYADCDSPVRAGRDQPARGAAAHRPGAARPGADRPGPSRRRPAVTGGAGSAAPLPRTAVVAARARAVPVRPAGRRTRHLAAAARATGRGARRRPVRGDPEARAGGAAPGPIADESGPGTPRRHRPFHPRPPHRTPPHPPARSAANPSFDQAVALLEEATLDRVGALPAGRRRARHRQVAARHRPRRSRQRRGFPGACRSLPRGRLRARPVALARHRPAPCRPARRLERTHGSTRSSVAS